MIPNVMRRFVKNLLGERNCSLCRIYSAIPRLMFQELRRILRLTHYKWRHADDPEVLLCALRTSAHIIDKGLQSNNWEAGRSRVSYERMCSQIERLRDSSVKTDSSYHWALEMRAEYERAQESGRADRHVLERTPTEITKDELLQLIQSRRSIRSFEDRPIEPDVLKELASVIDWSPTSCNRQPAKLFITQNPEKVAICMKQCAGATCFGEAIPYFIAVCADTRFYMIQDRNLPLIDVSIGLQNMLLMAHLQGIEGTTLNWMHHTPKEDAILRSTLGIPEYYLVVVNLVMGYSTQSAPAPRRKGNDLSCVIVK